MHITLVIWVITPFIAVKGIGALSHRLKFKIIWDTTRLHIFLHFWPQLSHYPQMSTWIKPKGTYPQQKHDHLHQSYGYLVVSTMDISWKNVPEKNWRVFPEWY